MRNSKFLFNDEVVVNETTDDNVYSKNTLFPLSTLIKGLINGLKSISELTKSFYNVNIANLSYSSAIVVQNRSDYLHANTYGFSLRFSGADSGGISPYTVIASGFPKPIVPNTPILANNNTTSDQTLHFIITANGELMCIDRTLANTANYTLSGCYNIASM